MGAMVAPCLMGAVVAPCLMGAVVAPCLMDAVVAPLLDLFLALVYVASFVLVVYAEGPRFHADVVLALEKKKKKIEYRHSKMYRRHNNHAQYGG